MQAQITQLHLEIQTLHSHSRPKPALPAPDKFNGSTQRFDIWLPSIRAKLRVDGIAIGDPIAQFYYVFLNLDSHVQAMVLLQLEAEDKLLSLQQGTDSIPVYISKFERTLYEVRGQDWPDINKISVFRKGLSPATRNRLNQQLTLPQRYPDFVRVVQQLAGRGSGSGSGSGSVFALIPASDSSNHSSNHHYPCTPQVLQRNDSIEISSIGINALDIAAIETGPSTIINTDNNAPYARSISPACRDQYREQGRCVRCGSYDHWVGSCLLQPHKPEARKQVAFRRNPVDLAALDPTELNTGSDDEWDTGDELERLQKGEI
ncbi:hypothetical protein OIDMADRAFT_51015 [Oidiodendron maius Zn]|uniref:Retrotransposon gag domain-containing protein n=1 Tax=Oidiodendron maius (strain Zn) TaxID=913774 RepID=A0A0C3D1T7_OIDMZ|nr:hypothetical protein OIDMADRAFT_51015 [Oidiodendron maius Zn]